MPGSADVQSNIAMESRSQMGNALEQEPVDTETDHADQADKSRWGKYL